MTGTLSLPAGSLLTGRLQPLRACLAVNPDRKLTCAEAAEFTGLTRNALNQLVFRKAIPFHRVGPRTVYFTEVELTRWMAETGRDR